VDVSSLLSIGAKVLVVVAFAVLGLVVARVLVQRILKSVAGASDGQQGRRKQLDTLVRVGYWATRVTIVSVAVLMIVGNFVDITPLLASVGVLGLALSLGAQTVIKDLIAGLLVLIEGQYVVGDLIQVGDISGTVEHFTLRSTYVRDIAGKLYIIPNGEVRIVSSLSKGWARATVDIGVAYEEDLDHVLTVLERVAEQWGVARELRKRILAACERENITLPYPRQEVFVRQVQSAGN
jgi:small-conductance mechanosensitive channel